MYISVAVFIQSFGIIPGFVEGYFSEQLLFLWVHLIIRCFIIAVRYGFASELRFLLMNSAEQSPEFLNKDLFFVSWVNFNPVDGLAHEIDSALYRN